MSDLVFIVQASSTSWSGGQDLCMNEVDGLPVVYWTVKRIFDSNPDAKVVVAAPAFDRGGRLEFLFERFGPYDFSIHYGHDSSPLDRLIDVSSDWRDECHFIRVDGLHCFFDVDKSIEMWQQAVAESLDCVKSPDNYPVQFTSDVYRIGALRKVRRLLSEESHANAKYRVHPKFYMFHRDDEFQCKYLEDLPVHPDDYLRACRLRARAIYLPREEYHDTRRLPPGDAMGFRYEFAAKYLDASMKVLDVACGWGFGTRYLSQFVKEVHGADIDYETVRLAGEDESNGTNVLFHVEDATNLNFEAEFFDAVVSIETIEHLNASLFLKEVHRVLKPNGRFVLSTPQNCIGHIPINYQHIREYSLEEIASLCAEHFEVEQAVGQKAGRIYFENDPIGSTTLLVCRKKW